MSDDPRTILREAGVEVPEVDEFLHECEVLTRHRLPVVPSVEMGVGAILALARLVAKYKWQRDQAIYDEYAVDGAYVPDDGNAASIYDEDEALKVAAQDLDRRWDER